MARPTFTCGGRTYSDARAGWVKAARDEWDDKLRRRGHVMRWRKVNRNTYEGRCTRCGGEVSCGDWGSSSPGYDIRSGFRRCRGCS